MLSRKHSGRYAGTDGDRSIWRITLLTSNLVLQNKVFVANEHCQMVLKQDVALAMIRNEKVPKLSNLTEIPDSVFDILKPVFIIRNPVFSIPSNYVSLGKTSDIRPGDEAWDLMTGTPLQRHLFDLFRERDGHPPLVFDGDDVVWNTEEMGRKICEALNLDPSGISEKWEAKPEAERSSDPLIRHFLLDSDNSTGIIRGTHAPPDGNLERAYETWVAKFGEDAAKVLEQRAQRNMVDYEYLKQYAQ